MQAEELGHPSNVNAMADLKAVTSTSPARPRETGGGTRVSWLVAASAALILVTFAAYFDVGHAGFLNLDDDAYVEHQPLVNQGIGAIALEWAFTGIHSNNWHPLTTLSHLLDCTVFGLNAAPMHWENLCWHALNSVLVLLAWRAVTGAFWRSFAVAALFALHPLHVESVAWISERKDLLSGFFWLLGLLAYVRYVRAPSVLRHLLVVLAAIGALLSKPMAVTFPCTLLLLDFWPLRRWPSRTAGALLREKLPLFALVAAHSIVTFLVQSSSGAANFGERFTLGARLGNAVVAYARYLGKAVWPETLAPLYFHPGFWPVTTIVGALAALVAISFLVWRLRATRPWLIFGWLWFLGTLVPVIGIIQVGAQSMADRYMYLPILGVFTLVVWECAHLFGELRTARRVVALAALSALAAAAFVTKRQVTAWRDSITLYERSIAAGEDNAAVRYLLALSLQAAERPQSEVVAQFQAALKHRPDYTNALTQLAVLSLSQQRIDEARALLEHAVRGDAQNSSAHKTSAHSTSASASLPRRFLICTTRCA